MNNGTIFFIFRAAASLIACAGILMSLRELIFIHRLFGFRDETVKPDTVFARLLLTATLIPLLWITDSIPFLGIALLALSYSLWISNKLIHSTVGIAYLRYLQAMPGTSRKLPPRPDLAGLPLFSRTEKSFRAIIPEFNIFDKEEIEYVILRSNEYEKNRRQSQ